MRLGKLTLAFTLIVGSLFQWAIDQTAAQDRYAVLIGVEDYDVGMFEPLAFAEDDAAGLGSALDRLGFSNTVMTSEASSPRHRPTSPEKILTVVKTTINSCVKGDTIIVSLSGHGVQFLDEEPLETGVKEVYFCPEDADISDKSTLLPISKLQEMLTECDASRKLLLIDSCREDVVSTTGRAKAARKLDLGSVHENRNSVPGGMSVLFSCSSGQFSWEHEELGHSVFTNFVISYLSGEAEDRFYDDGNYELDGLVLYVRKKTNQFVFDNVSADGQSPVLRGATANWKIGEVEFEVLEDYTTVDLDELISHANNGTATAIYELGERYYNGRDGVEQDYAKAMEQYRKAADKDHAYATYSIGYLYSNGQGVEQDADEAFAWFQKAADLDAAHAYYEIGRSYKDATGVDEDYVEARKWFTIAAEREVTEAEFEIGYLLHEGLGGSQDFEGALEWYERAAAKNYGIAQYNIGVIHENEEISTVNPLDAVYWYKRALENGFEDATERLDILRDLFLNNVVEGGKDELDESGTGDIFESTDCRREGTHGVLFEYIYKPGVTVDESMLTPAKVRQAILDSYANNDTGELDYGFELDIYMNFVYKYSDGRVISSTKIEKKHWK